MVLARVGRYTCADRIGKAVIELTRTETDKEKSSIALVGVCIFVMHLRNPFPESLDLAVQAKQLCLSSGNTHSLFYCVAGYSMLYIASGLSLEPFSREIVKLHEMFCDLKMDRFAATFRINVQFVMNLMGRSKDPLVLTGELMNEDQSRQRYTEWKHDRALQLMANVKLFLAIYFGDMTLAKQMSKYAATLKKEGPKTLVFLVLFCQGLIAIHKARCNKNNNQRKRRSHKKNVKTCPPIRELATLEGMVRRGCGNVVHYILLLQAEQLSIVHHYDYDKLTVETVRLAYDRGIAAAARMGITNIQALGNELAGAYFLRQGDPDWSMTYLQRAWTLYHAWGAKGKARHMQVHYGNLLDSVSESKHFKTGGESDSSNDNGSGGGYFRSTIKARERFQDLDPIALDRSTLDGSQYSSVASTSSSLPNL